MAGKRPSWRERLANTKERKLQNSRRKLVKQEDEKLKEWIEEAVPDFKRRVNRVKTSLSNVIQDSQELSEDFGKPLFGDMVHFHLEGIEMSLTSLELASKKVADLYASFYALAKNKNIPLIRTLTKEEFLVPLGVFNKSTEKFAGTFGEFAIFAFNEKFEKAKVLLVEEERSGLPKQMKNLKETMSLMSKIVKSISAQVLEVID